MKVLFAGPSIHGAEFDLGDVVLRRPVEQGDLAAAVAEGATAVGLVDGHYQQVAAVWHKEILDALTQGVRVFGAASMGALRAAECQAFGMIPIGEIAWEYCRGSLFDDADVALVTGPAELDYVPLTEPMVDVRATLAALDEFSLAPSDDIAAIARSAERLFFADRSMDAIFADPALGPRRDHLRRLYERHRVNRKAHDALELLDVLRALPDHRGQHPPWRLSASPFWPSETGYQAPESVTLL